jgi:cation diffusion facilitator CzcD-associated flavoprotein CzcO
MADSSSAKIDTAATVDAAATFDAVVIGAGVAGLCALYRLREAGFSVLGVERGGDVGGVWYWNRYPGARFDSESYTYCYSFSQALLDDWNWRERFAAQPEVLDYLNHVADRFDLRRGVRFGTAVIAARFDVDAGIWAVTTDRGELLRSRFLISAAGALSEPQWPELAGLDEFAGVRVHTARWPRDGIDLVGRRVGVIGTGATGVQVVQTIAPIVGQLTVFQRTPTYCIPQRNSPIDAAEMRAIKGDYPALLQRCRASFGGFVHDFDPRLGATCTPAEREALFETLWQQPGFAFWFGNFADLLMDAAVNEHACEFLRRKIRERVTDPETARRLLPRHPFGTKRVPLENGYYEVFNRPNVRLVDLRESPIERVTATGVMVAGREVPLDVLICATGFDAVTGALARIEVRGRGGLALADKWRREPSGLLGMLVAGFPNLFTLAGPHNAASLCNAVRCTEQNVDWVVDCLAHMRAAGYRQVEASLEAEMAWSRHVDEAAAATLLSGMTDSWFYGANTPGKPRRLLIYPAGAAAYRARCEAEAEADYPGLRFA